ncbi:MAG: hypothetical protein Q4F21_04665 [Lachnospiraceae bacterium]|nr:hypothetical protein [Lachnospiraceae bacterium]
MRNKKLKKCLSIVLSMVLMFSFNSIVYASEVIENGSNEALTCTEGEKIQNPEVYVDGIYDSNKNSRAYLSGLVRLAKSGTKLGGSYSSSYTYAVDRIGVKNVKLQYKGALGVWLTIITLDDRYVKNDSTYLGGFTCSGTLGRTYRLKATHYITDDGRAEFRDNITGELTF